MAAADCGHRLEDRVMCHALTCQHLAGGIARICGDGEQNVFGGDVFVFEALSFVESALENFVGRRTQILLRQIRNLRQTPDLSLYIA